VAAKPFPDDDPKRRGRLTLTIEILDVSQYLGDWEPESALADRFAEEVVQRAGPAFSDLASRASGLEAEWAGYFSCSWVEWR